MSTLRTLFLTGTLLMVACAGARNGDGPKAKKTAETKARERTDGMTADLALTAEQVPRVLDINRRHAEKMAPWPRWRRGATNARPPRRRWTRGTGKN